MYEQKALTFAEGFGVIEYQVKENKLTYFEKWQGEGTYKCVINLDTMEETRTLI